MINVVARVEWGLKRGRRRCSGGGWACISDDEEKTVTHSHATNKYRTWSTFYDTYYFRKS